LASIADLDKSASTERLMRQIESVWRSSRSKPKDEYICVVDSQSRLVMHTASPETVGTDVGENLLLNSDGRSKCSLQQLVARRETHTGGYVASSGSEQIVAFVPIPDRHLTLGVHRSQKALNDEIRAELESEMFWYMAVCGLVLPLSLLLIYFVFFTILKTNKEVEQALFLSEQKFSKAFNASPVWVSVTTVAEGRLLEVNDTFSTVTGYTREEAIGRTSFELNFWLDPQNDRERALEMYRKQGNFRNLEMNMRFKDGKTHTMLWSVDPIEFAGQECFINVLIDISDRKELEAQLRQAQKMEAIGTLAGGIAHDFNNILAAIMGYTELTLYDLPPDSIAIHNLRQSLRAASRAQELIGQILSFSRQTEQQRTPLKLGSLVKETLRMLRATIPSTIEIRQNLKAPSAMVLADPTQIHQVIMNLCANAAHAMRDAGGVLDVTLDKVDLDEEAASSYPNLTAGAYLTLVISDTGCGMEPEVMERIFEPFFTTKAKGEGTGMGLSVVHGIVKNFGGAIFVQSSPGEGSRFSVFLPEFKAMEDAHADEDYGPIPTGSERILWIDDEKLLIEFGRKALGRLGYSAECRSSSLEALELFRSDPHGFHLVITDQTMPGMTGLDLVKELKRIRSDIPVILMTGFSEKIESFDAQSLGVSYILNKPLVLRDLALAIRSALDQGKAPGMAKYTATLN